MKTLTFTPLIVLVLGLLAGINTAQAQAAKFGKISDEELKMRTYAKDTSAAAVILSDHGFSHFQYSNGFKLIFERQTRIKILKKSGYTWADFDIPVYERGTNKEKVTNIKGYSYNLVNGKVQKEKLDSKAIFDEQKSENWSSKKFTMPNVKEGTVIEVSYTIYSDFLYNMREWAFQETIPVVWSEYRAQIPEYFDYKLLQQGYLPFYDSKKEKSSENFMVRTDTKVEAGYNGGRIPGSSSSVNADGDAYVWVMKDVPALRGEKYITTLSDYQSKIEFELQRVKFPGEATQIMTGNWDDVTRDLLESDKFGVQLNRNNFFKSELAAVMGQNKTPESQMEAIYELVKRSVKWNGKYGIYAYTPIRKVFMEKAGSAPEINLLLTSMLLEAGLEAAPVLVSTREHGRVYKGTPMLNKFNYVVTNVRIGDKDYLLDATEPLLPAGMLPVRCLNGEGRVIKRNDQRWISLAPSIGYTKLFSANITINSKGDMEGTGTESVAGYNALSLRRSIQEEGEAKYAENMTKATGKFKVLKPKIINLEVLQSPVGLNYELLATGNGQENTMLYLNPLLGHEETENPFKLEERQYPVDFAAPMDETYICNFVLPEGYEVEEMPESKVIALPENGGRFMYVVQQHENTVQFMSKISISKPVFYAPEYAYLKEFFNQIITKQAEQLVLKKSTAGAQPSATGATTTGGK